jgi:hypothetical protein
MAAAVASSGAQTAAPPDLSAQVQHLTQAVAQTQAQLEASQRQLDEMRKQLADLQAQLANNANASAPLAQNTGALEDLRERQDAQEAAIATHEQEKVESASKYPVKLSGLFLFNGFVNAGGVDWPDTPTVAQNGAGTTGLSIRQTILGIDARGPHLFGGETFADARVDFYGNPQVSSANYSGAYYGHPTLLRLRTAHASVRWGANELGFALDRPIISPDAPSSLTALASPALAWSGNLWQWNPQLTFSSYLPVSSGRKLQLQAALIDAQDAIMPALSTSTYTVRSIYSSLTEQSRWPGVEGRIALTTPQAVEHGTHFGIGGYLSPHLSPDGDRYNAWAVTLDGQTQVGRHLELTASAYRGRSLGGLGGGVYKDFVYSPQPGGYVEYKPLDAVGGWAEVKARANTRLEFNGAFGVDNGFSHQVRPAALLTGGAYQALARNRTATANVIYTPSAYLLFSVEYRHLITSPAIGASLNSNVLGVAAGYRF